MIAQSPHARVRCHPGRIRFRYPPARFFASRRQTLERAASLRLPSSSRSLRVDCASPPPLPQRLSNALHHLTALVADSVEGVGWQSTRETSAKLIYRHEMGHAIMGMNLARTRNNTPDAGCARLTDSQTHNRAAVGTAASRRNSNASPYDAAGAYQCANAHSVACFERPASRTREAHAQAAPEGMPRPPENLS